MNFKKYFDEGYYQDSGRDKNDLTNYKSTWTQDINGHETAKRNLDYNEINDVATHCQAAIKLDAVQNETVKRTSWKKRVVDSKDADTEKAMVNNEQEKVIWKLKSLLNFLEGVQIKNEESLVNINKPLDDLLSSVKYLPIGPSFELLPVEIKTMILNYLCDSGAFIAASVCQEWKIILKRRLKKLDEITIGKCCSDCQDFSCFMPEEMLRASIILRLDIPLSICSPVLNVDSKLIAEGLTSVSDFAINNECDCREDNGDYDDYAQILTKNQIEDLIEALEKKTDTVTNVYLEGLNMTHLDQDRLVNCLLRIKHVRLVQGRFPYDEADDEPILDIETLVRKLLEGSVDTSLNHLDLEYIEYPEELSVDFADALCKVGGVDLGQYFPLTDAMTNRIIKNILIRPYRPINTKCLIIRKSLNWRDLVSPETLKFIISSMERLEIRGRFSSKQLKAARSVKCNPKVKTIKDFNERNVFTVVKTTKNCWASSCST